MLEGLLSFYSLFLERIIQYDLVPLNQSLTVLLPVLQLFVAISLDSFEECRKSKLLAMAQFGFSLLNDGFHLSIKLVALELLQ